MAGKRKRNTRDTTIPRKRSKAALADSNGSPGKPPTRHPHGHFDEEQEYKIRAIVDESRTHYRIQWEDDEITGEKYDVTWEPKEFANRLAIDDWEATKRQRSAAAREATKETATQRSRGRPRKIIESSPPPPTSSPHPTNGNATRTDQQQQPNEDLEIGESQPTVAGAEEGSGASSPLFVPVESPKPSASREKEQPSVQISDPPSSYAAGAYQNFSSSQIPESAAPKRRKFGSLEPESQVVEDIGVQQQQRSQSQSQPSPNGPPLSSPQAQTEARRKKKSPEPSQWQPEEGDTSRTTNDTTEVSAAPTSSSAPARSVPVNFEQRPSKVVPDSQSLPDSSSFVPSGTQTQSSSAPESRGRGRPPKEVTQVLAQSQSQGDQQSSWQGISSQPAVTSQQPSASQFEVSQQSRSGVPPQPSQTDPTNNGSQAERQSHDPSTGSAPLQPAPSQSVRSGAPNQEDSGSVSGFASQLSSTRRLKQSQDSLASQDFQASDRRSGPSSTTEQGVLIFDHQSPLASSSAGPSQKQLSNTSQLPPGSNQQAEKTVTSSKASSKHSTQVAPLSQVSVRETTERNRHDHIDLTADTQPPAGQTSSISVTPLPARHTIAAERNTNSVLPVQSSQSPFPFQTQFARNFSSTASGGIAKSQGPLCQGQPLWHSQPSLGPAFEPSAAPAAFTSPIRTSSPLQAPPERSIRTFQFGESAPPRPRTPSSPLRPSSQSSAMDDASPSSTSAVKEKLRAMRARQRAKLESDRAERSATPVSAANLSLPQTSPPKSSIPAHVTADTPAPNPARLASPLLMAQDGARSPSVVPHVEALPEITTEEMNTSERYATLLPQASVSEDSEAQAQRNGSLTGKATPMEQQPAKAEDPETASAHVIPISLVGHQRDQYPQMVYYHQELIQKFLETRNPDEQTVEKAKAFVERMRSIALHPDLDNAETATQYDVAPAQQATWDVSCSAKFRFLKTLLLDLQIGRREIVIALQNGRLVNILKTFLQGIDVTLIEAGLPADPIHAGYDRLRVTILTEDTDAEIVEQPDLVIGLDNSFHHDDPKIRTLRHLNGKWAPFVSLVVPRSIEHIENHLSSSLSDQARLRALVSGINQLKSEAGRLEEGQLNATDSANALASYVRDEAEGKVWPLAGLSSLEDLDSQTESEVDPPDTASPAAGTKRQRTASEGRSNDDDLSKRVRIEPSAPEGTADVPTTVNPQDVELTHISDSIDKLTQSTAGDDPVKTDIERQLQRLLQEALIRNEELTSALSDLQYRHEDARTHLVRTTSERDQAATTAATAIERMSAAANRESTLRNERSELKNQLEEAKLSLLEHSIPERAELETLRLALAQAHAERDNATKRLEQARKDSDFFRDQYQNASNSAQREAAENSELKNQLAVTVNRATGEQVRLRQMGYDERTKQLADENRRLKAVLKDRDAGLKFRDEEIAKLKEASRGRMGTRGTSVPRSPRLASPIGGVRSRQGSPAVGELKGKGSLLHPLRNNA